MKEIGFLKDIQSLITSATNAKVYRESNVPPNPNRGEGFVAWDFFTETIINCSENYTGPIEGTLDVTCYALSRSVYESISEGILGILAPTVEGKRTDPSPINLEHSLLQQCQWENFSEIFAEKTGHSSPETPGLTLNFLAKFKPYQ